MPIFFILFVLVPLAEIFVFISVSGKIGLGVALLMALCTAVLGGMVVRYQGLNAMMGAQEALRKGDLPTKELFDGLCLVAAGALLITPGFITDAVGFSLLIPAVRDYLRGKLARSENFKIMEFNTDFTEFHDAKSHHRPYDPNVIEAEFETVEENDKGKDGA